VATDWTRRSSADDIDPRFALRVESDGTIWLFDESSAPWLSHRLERAHRKRVALVLGWRKPTRADLNRMARQRRGEWAVLAGGALEPAVSAAKLEVIRGGTGAGRRGGDEGR
jgi:hypothetical protein